ncbi:hypothetical protein [Pseudomonas putida]|uniref:hypothetical protein n=1 Tax=Pseudomonas putida TaxID=303 RepID=UPI00300F27BE
MNMTDQIKKLTPKPGDLLVISIPGNLPLEQLEKIAAQLRTEATGFQVLVLPDGITAQLQPSTAGLLAEQQKQTALLEQIATQNLALIEALAGGDDIDPDAPPSTYLSGAPLRGGR